MGVCLGNLPGVGGLRVGGRRWNDARSLTNTTVPLPGVETPFTMVGQYKTRAML